ncbi:hypothetical protein B296_00044070, partial [Ensete ventricosum]
VRGIANSKDSVLMEGLYMDDGVGVGSSFSQKDCPNPSSPSTPSSPPLRRRRLPSCPFCATVSYSPPSHLRSKLLPLLVAALAAATAPCGLVAGGHSLRVPHCKWLCPRVAAAPAGWP